MRHFVVHYLSPPSRFFRVFVPGTFGVLRAFAEGRIILVPFFVFKYQDLSANQWYIARLALAYLVLSHTSDAALSIFVPRFQRSGDCSFFSLPFAYLKWSDLLSDSLCAWYAFNRLILCKLELWEWGLKRRIFDPFSESPGWVQFPPDSFMYLHNNIRPFRVG